MQRVEDENQTYSPGEATRSQPNLIRDHFKDQFFMSIESSLNDVIQLLPVSPLHYA